VTTLPHSMFLSPLDREVDLLSTSCKHGDYPVLGRPSGNKRLGLVSSRFAATIFVIPHFFFLCLMNLDPSPDLKAFLVWLRDSDGIPRLHLPESFFKLPWRVYVSFEGKQPPFLPNHLLGCIDYYPTTRPESRKFVREISL